VKVWVGLLNDHGVAMASDRGPRQGRDYIPGFRKTRFVWRANDGGSSKSEEKGSAQALKNVNDKSGVSLGKSLRVGRWIRYGEGQGRSFRRKYKEAGCQGATSSLISKKKGRVEESEEKMDVIHKKVRRD